MSGGPRNRKGFARGQARRAEIRGLMQAHSPLLPPLMGKEIRERLTCRPPPSVRTVQRHMAAIRLEAELAALGDDDRRRSASFIT